MNRILHVIPATPPAFNGLGDYARMLHRHWPEPRPEWHIAAMRVTEGAETAWPGVTFHKFDPKAESLARTLDEARCETVALHYVGQGYNSAGAPLWLPEALAQWRRRSGARLVVLFHETYATAPPWKRAFYRVPKARAAIVSLLHASDAWATSNEVYFRRLDRLDRDRDRGRVVCIGANVEPIQAPNMLPPWPLTGVPARIVVFGSPPTRHTAILRHAATLRHLVASGLLGLLTLAGAAPDEGQRRAMRALLTSAGIEDYQERYDLAESDASRLLSGHDAALLKDEWRLIHKSGVYAACVAHGLHCVLAQCEVPLDAPVLLARTDGTVDSQQAARAFAALLAERERLGWPHIIAVWQTMLS